MTLLTHVTFPTFVESNKFAVVHFWAVWNGHDAKMKTILSELAPQFPEIAFDAVDTDPAERHPLCLTLGIRTLPYLSFFRGGSQVESISGLRTKEVIASALERLVG